jgi:hypothetical protein
MPADRARVSYDPSRKWGGLVAQQGRVSVEADWNEAVTIDTERDRVVTLDVVGPVGTPDGGYAITPADSGDFTIGAGTLYLGGERLDLDAQVTYSTQPEWLDHSTDPLWKVPAPPNASGTSYELIYLLATEQEVSAVEDPALADTALGGPDTMQRLRILQRFVRTQSQDPDCGSTWDAFKTLLGAGGQQFDDASMMINSTAALTLSFTGDSTTSSLCQPVAAGGYLGAENQMIRVMITSVDPTSGVPTIVWGFDDASVLYRIASAVTPVAGGDTTLTLASAPVDVYHYPQGGQLVELLRDAVQLTPPTVDPSYPGDYIASAAGVVTPVVTPYDSTQLTLVIPGLPAADADYLSTTSTPQPYLRIWQGTILAPTGQTVTLGDTGVAVTLTSSTNAFHPGDFWEFALRPLQPTTVYPARYLDGAQPPDGPRTWACPLAVLTWDNGTPTALSCVPSFTSLVSLTERGGCCTVDVGPADVDGGAGLQMLIDSYQGPVTVCLEPGIYTLPEPLILGPDQDGLTLQACRGGVTLQAAEGGPDFAAGLILLVDASSITIKGIELGVPYFGFAQRLTTFAGLPQPNAELLARYAAQLALATGISCVNTQGLAIEDCTFTFAAGGGDSVFGAGIFAAGTVKGLTLSGCSFIDENSGQVPFYQLAESNSGEVPFRLTFGYLQLPSTRAVLDSAVIERCLFQGVTVAALAIAQIGAVRIAYDTVRDCYGGFWLVSFTDPAVMPMIDAIAIGNQQEYLHYAAAGLAPLLDRIFVVATAVGQQLTTAIASRAGAAAVTGQAQAPDPELQSRASQLEATLRAKAAGGADAPAVPLAVPSSDAELASMRLDVGGCQVDAVVAGAYSGAGLLVFDFSVTPGSALIHDNRIRNQFPRGDTVLLYGLSEACVTANLIANEVAPVNSDDPTRSIVCRGFADLNGVPAMAITGNVFIDPTDLPPRPAGIPVDLQNWNVLNTVITYVAPPAVSSIAPTSGGPATMVTVSGTGFTSVTGVAFGSAPAASWNSADDSTITAFPPPGSGTVDIRVTNPAGTSTIGANDQFTYELPTVTSLQPPAGQVGARVLITGTGFTAATGVQFGEQAAEWTSGTGTNTDTEINADAPPGFGIVHVTVTTPAGTSTAGSDSGSGDAFTYEII